MGEIQDIGIQPVADDEYDGVYLYKIEMGCTWWATASSHMEAMNAIDTCCAFDGCDPDEPVHITVMQAGCEVSLSDAGHDAVPRMAGAIARDEPHKTWTSEY